MKQITITAYVDDSDCSTDIDRIVHYVRGLLSPELLVVQSREIGVAVLDAEIAELDAAA